MTLQDYRDLVKEQPCPWCGAAVSGQVQFQEADSGYWLVEGLPGYYYLWVVCPDLQCKASIPLEFLCTAEREALQYSTPELPV